MTAELTPRQFLALVYLDASDQVTARELPMGWETARAVLRGLVRKGYAAGDGAGASKYEITEPGRSALAAAREEARREAGI
jgi:hypothetical protein